MDRSRGTVMMALNVFRLCTRLRILGSVMMVIVLSLVGFTYHVLVLANYGPGLFHGGIRSLTALSVLLLFHALLVMLLWCYFSVVFTDPGRVPSNWMPTIDDESGDADPLVESSGLASNGLNEPEYRRIRYCRKCGRCVLKMDHHCIWVVNCVGALNYKYFLLFLFYTFLETTLVTLSLLPYFMAFFTDEEISGPSTNLAVSFIAFVLNLAFVLSILGFMIMHISFVTSNTTTIEAYERKATPKWHYDLGWRKNYEQVFGTDKRYWFIPAYSEEDLRRIPALQGLEFPIEPDVEALQQL
ncbi:probable protein S-acyltransferase 14 isoform X2 [Gastrolobium bilobum]|uniref:probable protein S-acyltransferase 14 isoform X2 n=1 Tax=Gastrolobium bilobum TaxID=150636 RepID=UPI002AB0BE8B|nr:probable protein S-acyltransferase 14 isoform X2 [Gastrolobium bilobum]